MTVSKRVRFEVLRRDGYTCRYCRSKDNPLTIDHVMPVALGGSDDPSNLVAACKDCNSGKSSAAPDAALVADVSDDSIRWAAAMKRAAEIAAAKRASDAATLTHFKEHIWETWTYTYQGKKRTVELPSDWEHAILRQLDAGLSMDDLAAAVDTTMRARWVNSDEFRYFMGVCKRVLAERISAAHAILSAEEATDAS